MKPFTFVLTIIVSFLLVSCGLNETKVSSVTDSPYFLKADKIIDIDGVTIRYREEGDVTKPTLLMVHGFTSSLETWDALSENLKADFHIVRLDLPGHGLTGPDPQERYSNEETVTILSQFIDALKLDRPTLIGNSLGGLVAWRLAEQSPEKVSKLVLIAPGGFSINGVTEEPVDVPMMVKFYLKNAPLAGVKQGTAALFADPAKLSEDRVTEIRDLMLQPGNGDAFVTRAARFTLPDPTEALKSLSVPTLILWGDKDVMVPVSHSTDFGSLIPNAQLKVYGDVGHVPQEEAPAQVADDIRAFLSEP